FIYAQFLKVMFCVGGYCLFKKEYRYIKCMWNYAQPNDAKSTYICTDINPTSIDKLLELYYQFQLCDSHTGYIYWYGHHEPDIYNREYFILLLSRFLQEDRSEEFSRSKHFNLPKLQHSILLSIKGSIKSNMEIVCELQDKKELTSILGI